MLKQKQQCLIGIKNHKAQPSGFRPDKTRALNGLKNIPGKACVKRVHIGIEEKHIKHRILTGESLFTLFVSLTYAYHSLMTLLNKIIILNIERA